MVEMVKTIKGVGGKADIVLFDGEGHGWRKSSTIRAALEKELEWFGEVLGLKNSP